ncbi:phosphate/phosphite/phosphonate ABC transporter substrate-binding protein [Ruania suaedae]|uniref:phosphate/phosphite/phosphonate ABC transporter substrate-binding protein n=1 Tax=Ruania suaedae TaxID=2897774 RepID=UPI001E511B94|nr:phosphate/phosphite/phosphonate ABC transporter substrate-binding protein [Ruania suaedae]UFU04031.1 phosphate/phosphite/phosphonate ABC transporter substrate-binding protein [Ruania suaedae]
MKRAMRFAAIGAAAALALTACASEEPADEETAAEETGEDTGEEAAADPEELVLGLVPSQDMDTLVEDADELGALIEAELGIPVTTTVTDSYAGLVTAMQTGQAQIGMFGPIALVQAADQAGAEIVLQSVRYGTSTYHTQWFTNDPDTYCLDEVVEVEQEDGSIYTFCNGTDEAETGPAGEDALELIEQDTQISMVDESSASGYYYPATQLERVAGLDPLALNTLFAGGHPNSIINVASGDYPVGVSFDDARDNVVEENPQIGEEVTVFAFSDEIPNDGVAVSGDLSEDLQQRIADAMVAVIETEEGATAFDEVYSIEGLVPADLEALDAAREVESNFAGL